MYYFCTYFDRNYLDRGLALYNSLIKHCSPFELWILCMDDDSHSILSKMQLPMVNLIQLSTLEESDRELLAAKENRSLIEYYFTCTPALPLYLLEKNKQIDIITYLDADLYLFSSIEPLFTEMNSGSIVIIGHRFPEIFIKNEIHGKYNVGLLSFRRDENGIKCLTRWREQCIEWCYDRIEGDKFADQKYLDTWEEDFSGVIVLKNKGIGTAPWNILNYHFQAENDIVYVDEDPLAVYHFHGLKRLSNNIFDTNLIQYQTKPSKVFRQKVYKKYIEELIKVNRNLEKYRSISNTPVITIRGEELKKGKNGLFTRTKMGISKCKYIINKIVNRDYFIIMR